MRKDDQQYSFVSPINISTSVSDQRKTSINFDQADIRELLVTLVAAQHRQNDLLEEIVEQLGSAQRQRTLELANWKRMNPQLANSCGLAAQKLSKVQTEFLTSMSEEIDGNYETLLDSEYYFNEFLDRFGPRFMHLNVILQLLNQLGSAGEMPKATL